MEDAVDPREVAIAKALGVTYDDLHETFDAVGGLDSMVEELRELGQLS
jgi:ATP-dependent 26S proteasome regulatory subunit